jgi:hypothetical protein
MPQDVQELFSLVAQSPDSVPLKSSALLTGTAKAAAEFRRGVNLTAGFDLRGAKTHPSCRDQNTSTLLPPTRVA